MNHVASQGSIAPTLSSKRLLPMLVPVVALALLAGVGSIGRTFMTPHTKYHWEKDNAAVHPMVSTARFNSAENTFMQYQQVGDLAMADKDSDALKLVQKLTNAPLSMDGDSFHNKAMIGFSPETLMISLGNHLRKKEEALQNNGDHITARHYIDALYEIGDRLASTDTPTFQSVKTAYHFHCLAAQAEAAMAAQTGSTGNAMAQYRLSALRMLWKIRILPQIETGAPAAAPTSLSYQVCREYRDEWSRIRCGEA